MRLPGTRLAMGSGLAWLSAWAVLQLERAAVEALGTGGTPALRAGGLVPQFLLPAFGFVGLMIFGMAQHFVPLFAGRATYSPRLVMAQVVVADAAVGLLLAGALAAVPAAEQAGFALWFLASLMFLASILLTLRRPATRRRPFEGRPAFRAVDRRAIPLTAASALYLPVSAAAFLAQSLPQTGFSFGPDLAAPSALHLYTLGFIVLMVFGVALHLYSRFLGTPASARGATAMVVLGVASPVGIVLAITDPGLGALFPASAAAEALAAFVFIGVLVRMYLRSGKRRPAFRYAAGSLAFLGLGIALGVGFAVDPSLRAYAPVHGWVNLLGFAGLMILGILQETVPAYLHRGHAAALRAGTVHLAAIVAGLSVHLAGMALAIGGSPLGAWLSVLGLAVLAPALVSVAWGTVRTIRFIVTFNPRKGPAPADV